jgi:hypothetical protein
MLQQDFEPPGQPVRGFHLCLIALVQIGIFDHLNWGTMLLTVSTTHHPATDLGYLLHKNPARVQTEELSFGKAHVFYPHSNESCCTAAVLLEVDPVALVRGRRGPTGEGGQLEQYVNDRSYGANSFISVALGRLFTTALNGKSKERQLLAETEIPLVAKLPVIAARGVIRRAGNSGPPKLVLPALRSTSRTHLAHKPDQKSEFLRVFVHSQLIHASVAAQRRTRRLAAITSPASPFYVQTNRADRQIQS